MKIALMYEIEMPKPWHEGREAEKFKEVLDQIQLADEMGFSHVFAVEHHGLEELSHCSSPELVFAAATQRTQRIRFGHGAILLPQPYNHPVRVAERISTLDILSGGRLDVGFARSVTLTEMGGFGIDPNDTRPMMEEALEIIPQLMTTERFPGYQGKYFTVGENRNVLPKPLQKPHPPFWMACSSPESFYIAADHGLGVLSFNIAKAETLAERIHNYRQMIKTPKKQVVARVNNQIAVFLMTLCGERNDETVEMAGEGMHWYMGVQRGQSPYWMNIFERQRHEVFASVESYKYAAVRAPEALLFGVDADEKTAQEAMKPKNLLNMGLLCAGNPDSCVKVLEKFEALGVDMILCFMEMGRVPHERTMESIRLFGKYVIPHFDKRASISHGRGAEARV